MLLCVLAFVATLMVSAAVATPSTPPKHARATLSARDVVGAINTVRAQHDLRPLRLVRPLREAAGQHSVEMGTHGYFAHNSVDGTSFWKRVGRYYGSNGYRYWSVGENLLWSSGTMSAEAAVTMWMDSPPHRKNLLDRHWRQIGLSVKQFTSAPGVYRGLPVTIVTADFGVRY